MSDQQTDTQTSSNNKSQQRKKGLSIFILLLLLIAIGSAVYWFFFIKGFEETEDAYVSGNQVMVSAQVAGKIPTTGCAWRMERLTEKIIRMEREQLIRFPV